MTVKEFISILKTVPENASVLINVKDKRAEVSVVCIEHNIYMPDGVFDNVTLIDEVILYESVK